MTIDYAQIRYAMVEQQVRPWEVLDARVLEVLGTVPREQFVPDAYRAVAYGDLEIPLGEGQRMLKPVVAGRALQALLPQPGEVVLEIGTGSGFMAALLGHHGQREANQGPDIGGHAAVKPGDQDHLVLTD